MKNYLSHRLISAGIWQISGRFSARIFDLLTLVVLSRFLSAADFGLVALAMTAISIAEAVTQLPLHLAMMGLEKPTRSTYDTAFTLSFLRGVALALILGGSSYLMAEIYDDARLVNLVWALAFAPIARGLASPKIVALMRELDFRRQTLIDLAGKATGFTVSVAIAVTTQNYWAIASTTICSPVVACALSYVLAPHRPRLSLSEWRLFSNFIGWNTLAQFCAALNWQIDRLLLGRLTTRASLGHFSMASDVAGIIHQGAVAPLTGPLLAAIARRNEDTDADLGAVYLKSSTAVFTVASPLFVGLSLLSEQAVKLALGPGWAETANILKWLALIALISLPVAHLEALAIPLGRVRIVAWRALAEFAVAIPAIILGGLLLGIPGVIAARALSTATIAFFGMVVVHKLVSSSVAAQLWSLRRAVAGLLALSATVIPLRGLIPEDWLLGLAIGSVAVSLIGGAVYVATILLAWHMERRPAGLEAIVWYKLLSKAR